MWCNGIYANLEEFIHLWCSCVDSTFVTSWWKFMGLSARQTTSSTWTPARRRSSVDTWSSISTMQRSKTTYIWVRTVLFFCLFFVLYCIVFIYLPLHFSLSRKVYPCNSSTSLEHAQKWKRCRCWDEYRGRRQWDKVCYFPHQWEWWFTSSVIITLYNSSRCRADSGAAAESPASKRRRQEERDLSFLQVKNRDGQVSLFVDLGKDICRFLFVALWFYVSSICNCVFFFTGVYTKNRNFRLYKSSKVGKNAAFTVADDNRFLPTPERRGISKEESVFLASLVCNLRYGS